MAAPKKCNFLVARIADIMLYIRGLGRRRLGIASPPTTASAASRVQMIPVGRKRRTRQKRRRRKGLLDMTYPFWVHVPNMSEVRGGGGCPFKSEGNRMSLEIFANISSGRSRGCSGRRATGGARRYGAVVTGSKFIFPRFARATAATSLCNIRKAAMAEKGH